MGYIRCFIYLKGKVMEKNLNLFWVILDMGVRINVGKYRNYFSFLKVIFYNQNYLNREWG